MSDADQRGGGSSEAGGRAGSGPDCRRIDPSGLREAAFPAPESPEYRVHFSEDAYEQMKAHAATTDEVELCGVLVGEVCKDEQGPYLRITGAIEGQGAKNYGAQVTFTHETWSHLHEVKDARYPDTRIVGWYHTHPGFGVFLSSMDTFIQENFFSEPYQVAVVIETRRGVEGCFVWQDGRCVPLRRYWVGDREVSLTPGEAEAFEGSPDRAKAEDVPVENEDEAGPLLPPSMLTYALVVLVFVGGVMIGAFFLGTKGNGAAERAAENEVYSILESAALGTLAAEDLERVRSELEAVRRNLDEGKADLAVEQVERLTAEVDSLKGDYAERRSVRRAQLAHLAGKRRSLSDRLEVVWRNQAELQRVVADLYLLRLVDALQSLGGTDPSKWSEAERLAVKQMLDRTLQLDPGNKATIERAVPGLVEHFYPPKEAAKKDKPDD